MPLDNLLWRQRSRVSNGERIQVRTRLAEAQNWRCCYCHVDMCQEAGRENSATLHQIAHSQHGGSRLDIDNLVVACHKCHRGRGDSVWQIHIEAVIASTAEALRSPYAGSEEN